MHQDCYGVRNVPKGDWYCNVCVNAGGAKAKGAGKGKGKGAKSISAKDAKGSKGKNKSKDTSQPAKQKTCMVCDVSGGALKPVAGGKDRWCHLFCSNWMPETFVKDLKTMEPIGGVDNIDRERATLKCEVCAKPKGTGFPIQCDYGQCSVSYHPLCAALSGTRCMEIKSDMTKEGCTYKSYCLKHSKVRANEKKNKAKAEEEEEEEHSDSGVAMDSEDDEPVSKKAKPESSTPEPSRKSARSRGGSATPSGVFQNDDDGDVILESAGKENREGDGALVKNENGDAITKSDELPQPTETLWEHTTLALKGAVPTMPTEPESSKMEEEKVYMSKQSTDPTKKPPKCSVCLAHKKGTCGTATAPTKCYRRREKSTTSLASFADTDGGGSVSDMADLNGGTNNTTVDPGPPPASMEDEMKTLKNASDLLKLTPDDEILGELLQAHVALAKASWITRTLASKALKQAKEQSAMEAEERETQIKWGTETERYEERWRGGKWREEYLRKRGLPSADAFGVDADDDPFKDKTKELVDPLVETGAMEDALCAVCGGGDSEEPNEIVFCERCELATHQDCYGVTQVPEGDWLCWPCHVAEVNEEIQKQPPSRPPRWLREPGDGALYDPRPACCLCPVRRGALRAVVEPPKPQSAGKTPAVDDSGKVSDDAGDAQSPAQARRATLVGFFDNTAMKDNTSDGKHLGVGKATPSSMPEDISDPSEPNNSKPEITRWAHVVCAQCVPGVDFLTNPAPGVAGAVIYGLDRVPTSAFESTCSLCSRQEGVTTACGWPGCAARVHPLCARRQGWLLSEITRQEDDRRVFCGRHSVVERRRIENGMGSVADRGGRSGRGGRGRGRGVMKGRGGRGPRRRLIPTREEMELLKRARFGLEKLRLLCEQTLVEQKQHRQIVDAQVELWTMQMAGLDDGQGANTLPSPPPSPRRTETWMTYSRFEVANSDLPPGFAFAKVAPGEGSLAVTFK